MRLSSACVPSFLLCVIVEVCVPICAMVFVNSTILVLYDVNIRRQKLCHSRTTHQTGHEVFAIASIVRGKWHLKCDINNLTRKGER